MLRGVRFALLNRLRIIALRRRTPPRLVRYGAPGKERPGMLDHHGRLRDLSEHVRDLAGAALLPASIERLRSLDPTSLPEVAGAPRLGPCVGAFGKIIA